MDGKSIELLEFPQIRQNLAGYASFEPSRELILKLEPLKDFERISLLLRQSAEARLLLAAEPGFSIGNIGDIREIVKLAAIGKILEPQDLLEVRNTLGALYYLRSHLEKRVEEFPLLWQIAGGIVELHDLEKDIGACFNAEGEMKDDASPALSSIRQRLRAIRADLHQQLQAIINSPHWQRVIQEPIITEREGRYVVPVKVEFRRDVRGIVHDVSNTGATAFVEPWDTIDAGNNLRELEAEEHHEIENILRGLSERTGSYAPEIALSIALAAKIDVTIAKARYAHKINAVEPLVLPFENNETPGSPSGDQNTYVKPVLKLVNARHPLLPGDAVPLSVEIGENFSILVITGPNTGGKTVALKTIGLLSMMVQAGLPIPASAESTVPLYDSVFADIGDEQSIAQTLSTFSWHVTNLVRIVNGVTSRSLVLLDELGTSTDPAEGSALARSLLLFLLRHGAMAVATTHFSELKAFAHTTRGLQNASLDFNAVTLAPTYHLTVGIPGGSNALATALRFGLPYEIINEAHSMLTRGSQELETLLSDLLNEKQGLEKLRHALEKEKAQMADRNIELENATNKLRNEEKHVLSQVRDQLVKEAAELFKEIRQTSAELRKEKSKEKIEQARKTLAAIQEKLHSGIFAPAKTQSAEDEKIHAGDIVWLKEADLAATVLSLSEDNRQIELQVGKAKLKVGPDAIEKIATPTREVNEPIRITRPALKARAPMELDLRGKRAEEVKSLLDSYLNDAAVSNLPWVRIIHGHGTGVVKQIVRETLAGHPLVKSFKAGERTEGGDGVTIASMK